MVGPISGSASGYAGNIDQLIWIIAILSGFWFLVAEGVLFYFMFKYRKKEGQPAKYITGELKEEMKWIHIPHNLIILCDLVIIFFAVKVWYNVKQELPPAQETVQIIGQQWAWTFVHPGLDKTLGTADDVSTIDELHLKVDTTYHYKLQSLDVLHDFSVPAFRLKQDAIPGREMIGWFHTTKTGQFDIQCAEMCGIGHGIMGAKLYIEPEAEHEAWLKTKGGQGT